MIRHRRAFKPFSRPSWIVGRDFPDPNTPPPGTVPNGQAGFTEPVPTPRPLIPSPTPPLYPDEGRAADPLQSAAPQAPIPVAEAPSQQPPARKPRKKSPAADSPVAGGSHPPGGSASNLQPQISNIQNNYHSGKCTICNHPDRAEIEAAFFNWEPAERIVAEFNLPARSTLYRHAKAADLLNQRRNNLRAALDQIIEQAGRVPATANSVISAIELSYRLSGANVAPLKRYETTHIHVHDPSPTRNAGCQPAPLAQSSAPENQCKDAAPSAPNSSSESSFRPPDASLQNSESNLQPRTPNLQQQSGHQNIVEPPNSLNLNDGDHRQSGHIGVPATARNRRDAIESRGRTAGRSKILPLQRRVWLGG